MTWHCDALFDETGDETLYLPNKAGETYMNLIHEEWKTKERIQIKNGKDHYDLRGFMGDYTLKIMQGSNILDEFEFKLESDLDIFCIGEGSSIICS